MFFCDFFDVYNRLPRISFFRRFHREKHKKQKVRALDIREGQKNAKKDEHAEKFFVGRFLRNVFLELGRMSVWVKRTTGSLLQEFYNSQSYLIALRGYGPFDCLHTT